MADKFRADGTIGVRFNADGKISEVMFIPCQHIEHNGNKFVVFVPWDGDTAKADGRLRTSEAKPAYVVAAKWVIFDKNCANKQDLLQAAVNRIKVTVLVSRESKSCDARGEVKLKLDEIFIPAIPT